MQLSNWHKATTWRERSAFLGRWALLLAFAALPIKGELVPLPLVIGIVLLLPQAPAFGRLQAKGLLLLPMAYYLLHVLGMAWSTDVAFGLFDLQVKLSLLLLPLVAAGLVTVIGEDMLRPAMAAFSIGLLVAMVLSVHAGIACYLDTGGRDCFTQSNFSAYIHPSYTAWYACWAMAYWGLRLVDGGPMGARWRAGLIAFLLLLTAYIVMITSKSGLIGLALVLVILLARAMRTMRAAARLKLVGLVLAVMAVPLAVTGPVLWGRLQETAGALHRLAAGGGHAAAVGSSTNERIVAWECSASHLADSPWGAGTGDIKHALMACYEGKGATAAIQHRLNSHSQVLQSGVALGWPGLLLVCALMLAPLLVGLFRGDAFLSIFAALFIINGTIESVLEVQAGVVFFILFYVILVRRSSVHRPQPTANP